MTVGTAGVLKIRGNPDTTLAQQRVIHGNPVGGKHLYTAKQLPTGIIPAKGNPILTTL